MKYLPDALRSIFSQDYKNFKVLIIDNGSVDGTVEFLRSEYPQVLVLKNVKNLGFASAHNQGIKVSLNFCDRNQYDFCKSYVLITNPDIVLASDFLEKIISRADQLEKSGSFGGKLLKIFSENSPNFSEKIIDSTGLKILKTRRIVERGAGEKDEDQYKEEEVFGVSGALALYRISALKDVVVQNEYFDSKYFAYKEDVDLAWRLRLFGWKSHYINNAIAHHHRGAYGSENRSVGIAIRERRAKNSLINYYSTSNHLFTILKNEFAANVFKNFPQIFFYEMSKFLYVLFLEPKTLGAYFKFFKHLPYALKWRKEIMARKRVGAVDIQKLIN
ncbi:MAG: glycosyltransferase family 2 protein [Parcubacteria group bacterium]|nr:glycosyltransferase family 2 protein [Parcubacteria group bacterium]